MTLSRHVDRPARPHQRRTVRAGSAGALAFAIALGGVGVASAASPVDVPVAGAKTISKPHSSRISVTTGGFHPGHGSNVRARAVERRTMSSSGRYVVFEGRSPLVKGVKALERQLFVRDRHLGTTTIVSVSSTGKRANKEVYNPQISADGRWIAFESTATNLVRGDTNGVSDVFLHDIKTRKTTRVSVTSAGRQVNGTYGSQLPSLSSNGRYISFLSYAEGVAPGDSSYLQAYLHDRVTKTTELVSLTASGTSMSAMDNTSVSADGRYVAFISLDGNANPLLYVRDRTARTTTGYAPSDRYRMHAISMTPDARYITYETQGAFDARDKNTQADVYVLNRRTGTHTLVSRSSSGASGNGPSVAPAISSNGRYVVFESKATNLVPGDTNKTDDVFRHDLTTGKTIRVSVRSNGKQVRESSFAGSINSDGRQVAFESYGTNITKLTTGSWGQVFVRSLNGKFPALHARVTKVPTRVKSRATLKISTSGIATGQKVVVTVKPSGKTKGSTVKKTLKVSKNKVKVRAPRAGTYTVTVTYDRFTLAKKSVRVS